RLIYTRWHRRPPREVVAWHRQVHVEVLRTLASTPAAWFGRRERSPEWPADLDGHSAAHRMKDIEAALPRAGGRPGPPTRGTGSQADVTRIGAARSGAVLPGGPLTLLGPHGRIRSALGSGDRYGASGSAWPIRLGARSSADRASDSGSEGQRFKSSRAYHLFVSR